MDEHSLCQLMLCLGYVVKSQLAVVCMDHLVEHLYLKIKMRLTILWICKVIINVLSMRYVCTSVHAHKLMYSVNTYVSLHGSNLHTQLFIKQISE